MCMCVDLTGAPAHAHRHTSVCFRSAAAGLSLPSLHRNYVLLTVFLVLGFASPDF